MKLALFCWAANSEISFGPKWFIHNSRRLTADKNKEQGCDKRALFLLYHISAERQHIIFNYQHHHKGGRAKWENISAWKTITVSAKKDPFVVFSGMEWINHIALGVRKHNDDNMAFGFSFSLQQHKLAAKLEGGLSCALVGWRGQFYYLFVIRKHTINKLWSALAVAGKANSRRIIYRRTKHSCVHAAMQTHIYV